MYFPKRFSLSRLCCCRKRNCRRAHSWAFCPWTAAKGERCPRPRPRYCREWPPPAGKRQVNETSFFQAKSILALNEEARGITATCTVRSISDQPNLRAKHFTYPRNKYNVLIGGRITTAGNKLVNKKACQGSGIHFWTWRKL